MVKLLLFILTISTAFASKDQVLSSPQINYIINNCRDINGKHVDYLIHEDIEGGAYATLHRNSQTDPQGNVLRGGNYYPVVYISTSWFYFKSIPGQAFTLAHECGHHALGHVLRPGGSHPRDEFAADCYGIHMLVKARIITKRDQILEMEKDYYKLGDGRPGPRSPSHPGTIERYDNINKCFTDALNGI